MIIPSKCPKCGDILVYEFGNHNSYSHKFCKKRLSHSLDLFFGDDTLVTMFYKEPNAESKLMITWDFIKLRIFIGPQIVLKGRSVGITTMAAYPAWSNTELPWFEPDLDDFPKLINKIKTYICFI